MRGWNRWADSLNSEAEEGEEEQMPRWGRGRQWSWADLRDRLQERWGQADEEM